MRLPLRNLVFWSHLAVGVVISGVVLMMSFTGVILTYEKQTMRWADRANWSAPDQPGVTAPVSELVAAATAYEPEANPSSVTFYGGDEGPAVISIGGGRSVYLDPTSAAVRGESNTAVAGFLRTVRGWHRWFNVPREDRGPFRAVTGWSNAFFFFLILSGLYLWFPRRWTLRHFRAATVLKRGAEGQARAFNWHNVFGFWSAIPLAVIVFSGAMISFPKARTAVTDTVVAMLEGRAEAVGSAATATASSGAPARGEEPEPFVLNVEDLNPVVAQARTRVDDWRRMSVRFPREAGQEVTVQLEQGIPGQLPKRYTVSYDLTSAEETAFTGYGEQPLASRLRGFFRFAHTGEFFGVVGQTVAGLVTLLSVILVWTGLALTWRRMLRAVRRRWREEDDAAEGSEQPQREQVREAA